MAISAKRAPGAAASEKRAPGAAATGLGLTSWTELEDFSRLLTPLPIGESGWRASRSMERLVPERLARRGEEAGKSETDLNAPVNFEAVNGEVMVVEPA